MTAVRAHPASPPPPTATYVREARRLRARHARQPARLAAELRKLSTKLTTASVLPVEPPSSTTPTRPVAAVTTVSPAPVLRVPPATAHAFATEVEFALLRCGGVLRYSARKDLLALAKDLRIAPFEANLLIASVLHHHQGHTRTAPASRGTGWLVVAGLMALGVVAWLLI